MDSNWLETTSTRIISQSWIKRLYFYYYVVSDRIDLSVCSETLPTVSIDVQKLIVDTDDSAMLHNDVIVLMSRLFMCIPLHIKSDHATDMSMRTKVVELC